MGLIALTFASKPEKSLSNGNSSWQPETKYSGSDSIKQLINTTKATKVVIGKTVKNRTISAYYFPGTSNKNALIIGGVHGSELSAIEVAKSVIDQLNKGEKPYYNVIVLPVLFPDNAAQALAKPEKIGSGENIGRYTHKQAVDPNRQMPTLGTSFERCNGKDHLGRSIEVENQLLLKIIDEFKPDRIVNLHAIRNINNAGFFADPRTDHHGFSLGFDTDSCLAIDMARFVHKQCGNVNGNRLPIRANATYPKDPVAVAAEVKQPRNINGSTLPGRRGQGVSLGSWATTAVNDSVYAERKRKAIRLITVEFPGAKRPVDYKTIELQQQCAKEVRTYASAIVKVFLADNYPEKVDSIQYTSVNKQ
ncbi:Zinc carboxypeptidase [compost metagenome]